MNRSQRCAALRLANKADVAVPVTPQTTPTPSNSSTISDAQLIANRANAKFSTGATTTVRAQNWVRIFNLRNRPRNPDQFTHQPPGKGGSASRLAQFEANWSSPKGTSQTKIATVPR
jgi:hypothetical protein